MTPGYYKREAATKALFHEDWLCTGDLAYLLDGQLILCGRIKDVIIVGGRNVFPEDIERVVGGSDGVRAGNVIAFGVDGYKGKESVVVVAEVRTDDTAEVREAIHRRTLEGVRPAASRCDAGPTGDTPQDQLRQAAAGQVQGPLPRRGTRLARLNAARSRRYAPERTGAQRPALSADVRRRRAIRSAGRAHRAIDQSRRDRRLPWAPT